MLGVWLTLDLFGNPHCWKAMSFRNSKCQAPLWSLSSGWGPEKQFLIDNLCHHRHLVQISSFFSFSHSCLWWRNRNDSDKWWLCRIYNMDWTVDWYIFKFAVSVLFAVVRAKHPQDVSRLLNEQHKTVCHAQDLLKCCVCIRDSDIF